MKKILLSITLLATSFSFAKAQGTLGKGNTQLNLGVGFSGFGLPVRAGLDFGVSRDITIGVQASPYFGSGFTLVGIGATADYHFNHLFKLPSKWDLYAGLGVGYYFVASGTTAFSGVGLVGHAGVRYFFTESLGVNLEGGGGSLSGGTIGITYKF